MSLTPGTRVGAYEILGSLGAGAMGEVFRACDPRLGRDVAIKFLHGGEARLKVERPPCRLCSEIKPVCHVPRDGREGRGRWTTPDRQGRALDVGAVVDRLLRTRAHHRAC